MYKINDEMKAVNLVDCGVSVCVDLEKVPEGIQEQIGCYYDDVRYISLGLDEVESLDIPYEAIDQSDVEYDEEAADDTLASLVKPAPAYLVFAQGCRWNGASGYKVCDRLLDTIQRNYDVTILPVAVSKGGKILQCRESSHDVPMGSITYIIALTAAERMALENYEFSDVSAFVDRCAKSLK